MTVEYDSLAELMKACTVLDAHGIGWAAASATTDNPFGEDPLVYRLYASEVIPA